MCDRLRERGVKALCGNPKLSAPKALSNLKTLRTSGAKPCQPSPLPVKNRTMENVHGAVFLCQCFFQLGSENIGTSVGRMPKSGDGKAGCGEGIFTLFPDGEEGKGTGEGEELPGIGKACGQFFF